MPTILVAWAMKRLPTYFDETQRPVIGLFVLNCVTVYA